MKIFPRVFANPAEAFTLTELAVVLGCIGILSGLLFPGLSAARAKIRSTKCVSNLKQLQLGWLGYAQDHDDRVIPNTSRSVRLVQQGVAPSWVLGNPKWDTTTSNLTAGLLYPYINSPALYRCPADWSRTASRSNSLPRTRSYSLNSWLGIDILGKGLSVDSTFNPGFKTRLGDIHFPPPSQVFGFLDENEKSIDDGLFATHDPAHWSNPDASPDLTSWMEMPSDRHRRGCTLSFLDGHVEVWRWASPKIFRDYEQPPASEADRRDLQRLQAALPSK